MVTWTLSPKHAIKHVSYSYFSRHFALAFIYISYIFQCYGWLDGSYNNDQSVDNKMAKFTQVSMKVTMFARQWLSDVIDCSHLHSTNRVYTQRLASTLDTSHLHSIKSTYSTTLPRIWTLSRHNHLNLRHNFTTMIDFTPLRHHNRTLLRHNYISTNTTTLLCLSTCLVFYVAHPP